MTQKEIKELISSNLENAGYNYEEVRVQSDRYGGWNIAVISDDLNKVPYAERKRIAIGDLDNRIKIEWLDLITTEEKEWSGTLPNDTPQLELPLWSEALSREDTTETILFPSDLDDDLPPPIIGTFYSLKGGVGRTTALAYTASILASLNKTVLCVDMDLEAPGLTSIFGKDNELRENQGLVHLLYDMDNGEKPDVNKHIIRISEMDELYCLPSGIPNADYARKLRYIDPEQWYREDRNPMRDLKTILAEELSFRPDVILFDARTGISSINAPLLFDLADIAFIVFYPHPQSETGSKELVKALLKTKTIREYEKRLTPELRFIISPLPAGLPKEVNQRYRNRTSAWISDWLATTEKTGIALIDNEEITHFINYNQAVATSDNMLNDNSVINCYEPVAEWIERFLPTKREKQINSSLTNKENILNELKFTSGIAEDLENLEDVFVETELVNKALIPSNYLILGRKGTGKTTIFRYIKEHKNKESIVVQSPAKLRDDLKWIFSAEEFKNIDKILQDSNESWRSFWAIYTVLACYLNSDNSAAYDTVPNDFRKVIHGKINSRLTMFKCIEAVLRIKHTALSASDWLDRVDSGTTKETYILYDGLDSSFGHSADERERRRAAVEGLFSFVTDRAAYFKNLKFKVLLREDIWRNLQFENKSHVYGSSVTIAWKAKYIYLKVLIKQALLSEGFRESVYKIISENINDDINEWDERKVFDAWHLLVGERMRGGKTAFTQNWVWKRLADANNDHTPRSLLQLFNQAKGTEVEMQKETPYTKTIIRPRALIDSLAEVSSEAVNAISEEFPELHDFIEKLKRIARSPVAAGELKDFDNELKLAQEVGLIGAYEKIDGETTRYKVPDIYLYGIEMTRKGQA